MAVTHSKKQGKEFMLATFSSYSDNGKYCFSLAPVGHCGVFLLGFAVM